MENNIEVKINSGEKEYEVRIPKWSMSKQLNKQKYVLPLVNGPISSAIAMASEKGTDESVYTAAIVSGVIEALSNTEMDLVVPQLLDGVGYRNSEGVLKTLTIKEMEDAGFELDFLYSVIVNVIKVNYGPLLKGGLQNLFKNLM